MGIVEEMAQSWQLAGLAHGDTVLLHSNIKRTLQRCRDAGMDASPRHILDSFLCALGPHGTLLLPLFNFDFTTGVPFDIRHSPSHMGALTEMGRQHPDGVRTGHPIYSFVAIGRHADRFKNVNNSSAYGADSPFGMLRVLDAKIAVLDLEDQHSMTFYHHVEEVKQVPYRYHKAFSGDYTDAHGKTTHQTYSIYVRDLAQGVLTHVNPAGECLWRAGLYKGDRPLVDAGLRVIRASDMFDCVAGIIDRGEALGTLYTVGASA